MNDSLIRVGKVASLLSIAKSTVWLWESQGKIPKSFKLTPSTTVWRYSEIMEWIDEKQEESDENAIKVDQMEIKKNTYSTKNGKMKKQIPEVE